MMKIGRRKRYISNVDAAVSDPRRLVDASGETTTVDPQGKGQAVVSGMKNRTVVIADSEGNLTRVNKREHLVSANKISAAGGTLGPSGGGLNSGGFGGNGATVDRYNPIYDDLSRGTVAEDWIPLDPRLQNRMFRIMYNRGVVEGATVETISELIWSEFDVVGVEDKEILGTYEAATDRVKPHLYMPDMTKEHLVIGRCVAQLILDPVVGIWSDLVIHDSDYLSITNIPRTGFMPKIDLIPSPEVQEWMRSTDLRDVEARKGMPKDLIASLSQSQPVPLDPATTAYMPRRSFFNDVEGTSFFVRNIPLWGLEKSLINATLTGHRRRSGPITQIAVGSEQWEPTDEQVADLVEAYTAAEEDSVSSTIGTRYDVQFNQIRGSLQEMWKWEDSWQFLQEAKMKMFGVSEQLIMGDMNIDTTVAPTVFMERLKAHRKYMVDTFLIQKFYRSLATVHNFRRRSQAELDHRIIVNDDDHDLILPTLVFKKRLDTTADMARSDLLDKMEEVGLPVTMEEWNRALGGGDIYDRMRSAKGDLVFRLDAMRFQSVKQKIMELSESASDQEPDELNSAIGSLSKELEGIKFGDDKEVNDINKLTKDERMEAIEMADGISDTEKVPASVIDPNDPNTYIPTDTKVVGPPSTDLAMDRSSTNRDENTLNAVGKAC